MNLFKQASALQKHLASRRRDGNRIGFVPTMGALHAGHAALVRESKRRGEICVVSIFVNPLQFNNPQDLEAYPSTLDQDIALLESLQTDILFLPGEAEMFPEPEMKTKMYDLGDLEFILEGAFRPGHFQGVCRVVDRLLQIVQPDRLYLGQKDYQQVMVLQRLLRLKKSNARIATVATVREDSGLALSSRNLRLSKEQKKAAANIFSQLKAIANASGTVSFRTLREHAIQALEQSGLQVEYLVLAQAADLKALEDFDPTKDMVLLIAAFAGQVRLIDNLVF